MAKEQLPQQKIEIEKSPEDLVKEVLGELKKQIGGKNFTFYDDRAHEYIVSIKENPNFKDKMTDYVFATENNVNENKTRKISLSLKDIANSSTEGKQLADSIMNDLRFTNDQKNKVKIFWNPRPPKQ